MSGKGESFLGHRRQSDLLVVFVCIVSSSLLVFRLKSSGNVLRVSVGELGVTECSENGLL